MAKRKTTRRWSGAGDGLVHGYDPWVWVGSDRVTRELLTYCGRNMGEDARGIWCRRPITCLICLANQPSPIVNVEIALTLPSVPPMLDLNVGITED